MQGNDFVETSGVWARCLVIFMCALNEHQGEGGKPMQTGKVNAPGKSSWQL